MSCFPCLSSRFKDIRIDVDNGKPNSKGSLDSPVLSSGKGKSPALDENQKGHVDVITPKGTEEARSFTFKELANATKNFREVNLIGEGGFGKVFKGRLESGQIVAVKQLNHEGQQGNQEFIVEVLMLSLLHHDNLVRLNGYCTAGDQRLLVYEYMSMGSLEHHLFDPKPGKQPLDWNTRIKIAVGAARGIEYLHCKANPPVIYRDLKSANILLDEDFNPKLSDFGLAKLGPVGDNTHVSTRVMGTYGYCAPEYAMSGKLTLKSDIYSFGVVLLELLTGRKVLDLSRKAGEQNLVCTSRPFLKDPKKFGQLADPLLEGRYPRRCFNYLVAITAMCLNEEATFRPLIGDLVVALEYLSSQTRNPETYNAGLLNKPQASSQKQSPLQKQEDSPRKRPESRKTFTSV